MRRSVLSSLYGAISILCLLINLASAQGKNQHEIQYILLEQLRTSREKLNKDYEFGQ